MNQNEIVTQIIAAASEKISSALLLKNIDDIKNSFVNQEIRTINNEITIGELTNKCDIPITIFKHKKHPNRKLAAIKPSKTGILIIGDLHGYDFILEKILPKLVEHLEQGGIVEFLGDYGNRGPNSIRTYRILFELIKQYPKQIVAIRGNHETEEIAASNNVRKTSSSLYKEIETEYANEAEQIKRSFNELWEKMPVMAVWNDTVSTHGGPPYKNEITRVSNLISHRTTLYQINNSDRIDSLLWGDPCTCNYNKTATFFQNGTNVHKKLSRKELQGRIDYHQQSICALQNVGGKYFLHGHTHTNNSVLRNEIAICSIPKKTIKVNDDRTTTTTITTPQYLHVTTNDEGQSVFTYKKIDCVGIYFYMCETEIDYQYALENRKILEKDIDQNSAQLIYNREKVTYYYREFNNELTSFIRPNTISNYVQDTPLTYGINSNNAKKLSMNITRCKRGMNDEALTESLKKQPIYIADIIAIKATKKFKEEYIKKHPEVEIEEENENVALGVNCGCSSCAIL